MSHTITWNAPDLLHATFVVSQGGIVVDLSLRISMYAGADLPDKQQRQQQHQKQLQRTCRPVGGNSQVTWGLTIAV